MRRLSVRDRGDGAYEVGPAGHGPTVMVGARSRRLALRAGKALLKERGDLPEAVRHSYRDNDGIRTRALA